MNHSYQYSCTWIGELYFYDKSSVWRIKIWVQLKAGVWIDVPNIIFYFVSALQLFDTASKLALYRAPNIKMIGHDTFLINMMLTTKNIKQSDSSIWFLKIAQNKDSGCPRVPWILFEGCGKRQPIRSTISTNSCTRFLYICVPIQNIINYRQRNVSPEKSSRKNLH